MYISRWINTLTYTNWAKEHNLTRLLNVDGQGRSGFELLPVVWNFHATLLSYLHVPERTLEIRVPGSWAMPGSNWFWLKSSLRTAAADGLFTVATGL